jgi:DNA-binding response OmpR family regulator
MKAKILLVEGKKADRDSFNPGLVEKGFHVDCVPSGAAALEWLETDKPHIVLVDAVSMRTSGKRICKSIRETAAGVPILLVIESQNNSREKLEADVVLAQPFTLQKLLNRIKPLLPFEQKNVLIAGPIHLNVENRLVKVFEHQVALTPRLVVLLKELIDHAGEVVERKKLFTIVWDTNYTDDTRTLDVHISWLREILEDDPRHPRYLKTIRGIGYRLDV